MSIISKTDYLIIGSPGNPNIGRIVNFDLDLDCWIFEGISYSEFEMENFLKQQIICESHPDDTLINY